MLHVLCSHPWSVIHKVKEACIYQSRPLNGAASQEVCTSATQRAPDGRTLTVKHFEVFVQKQGVGVARTDAL